MVSFRAVIVGLGLAFVAQLPSCLAYPTTNTSLNHDIYRHNALSRRQDDNDKDPEWLRIMPLGASITAGTNGDPNDPENRGDGYRKFLRDQLRWDGWEVNMVGTFQSGSMNDRDHEGVPGHVVSQVAERTKNACRVWRPNVVLINAGTNDATLHPDSIPTIGDRMRQVIDNVFTEVPDAVVVLSTLLPHSNYPGRVEDINHQYRDLVTQFTPDPDATDPPFKVILAEMHDGFIDVNEHLYDDVHPTTNGNNRMAAVWHHAILQAYDRGWISPPSSTGEFEDGDTHAATCKKEYGSGVDDPRAGRQVLGAADRRIKSDGQYKHGGKLRSDVSGTFEGKSNSRMWMAQLFNHGAHKLGAVAELVFVDGNHSGRKFWWRKNNGGGKLEAAREIPSLTDGCLTRGIHWGDVNGDGLDDFICIARDGEMFVAINLAKNGENPRFGNVFSNKKPEMGLGQEHVRLGDMDGDGRLDYCVITNAGYVHCWRNGGLGDKADYWQDMGVGKPIFNPKGMGDIRGVRFADINGDGRDDWLWLSKKGQVTTWINQRGISKTMIPYWQEAQWNPTHSGLDKNIDDDRQRIQFGRFFGSGKCDYLAYEYSDGKLSWRIWENNGKGGGKFQKGDGAYWGDMTGTGVDDYVWISPGGEVTIFGNKNTENSTDGYIKGPWRPGVTRETGHDRRGLHIGDWDGDGHADIIFADRETGELTVTFVKSDPQGSWFTFSEKKIPNSGKCSGGWGLLYNDHAAHFADISGSGKVDYLCMEPNGTTSAWIRGGDDDWDSLGKNVGQVKFAEGWDRANFQFADADGDGKADLIWTDKFSGDGWVWYNKGPGKPEDLRGSAYEWKPRQKVYLGSSRGPNMHFPNLGGQGRADMVGINPTTGKGQAWFNSCARGGDDGPLEDPGLEKYDPRPVEPPPPEGRHWFCDAGDAQWDTAEWNGHGIGNWLVSRIELYRDGDGVDFPRPGVGEAKRGDEGIPRIIGSYNGFKRDELFFWPRGCRDINHESGCNLSPDDLTKDGCKQHTERAFSLWAMHNLAGFIDTWEALFFNGAMLADLWTADIARKFLWHSPASDIADPGSWLTIVAGMLTSVGAFVPHVPTQTTANSLAGLGTIAAGAVGFMGSPPEDARFDDFAELSVKLGNYTTMVSQALTGYYNTLFRDTPAEDAEKEEAMMLPDLLWDGYWAHMDAAPATADENAVAMMTTQIRASVIAEAWNSDHVGIIKWSEDSEFYKVFGWNPCFGDKKKHGMDHAVACLEGSKYNYVITPMYWKDIAGGDRVRIREWPSVGQDDENLADYNLTKAKVVRAAERTQDIAHGYQLREKEAVTKFIEDGIRSWDGNAATVMEGLRYFNVPVCELDYATTINMSGECKKAGELADMYTKWCAISMMSTGCSGLVLGDVPWPYDKGPEVQINF